MNRSCRSLIIERLPFRSPILSAWPFVASTFLGQILVSLVVSQASSQTTAVQTPASGIREDARIVLVEAKAALNPAALPLIDMSLQGTVITNSASGEQSAIKLDAKRGGYTAVRTTLGNEVRSEFRTYSVKSSSSGSRTGTSAAFRRTAAGTEQISSRQAIVESCWFEPEFLLDTFLAQQSWVGTKDMSRTSAAVPAIRVSMSRHLTSSDIIAKTIEAASTINLFLSPDTLLPIEISFLMPAEHTRSAPAVIRVRFDEYESTGGHRVPRHITETINGVTSRDIHIDSVLVNPGLLDKTFDPEKGQQR